MDIDSIVIHTDIKDKLDFLSDAEAGQLFKAIIDYAENGTTISTEDRSGAVVMAFLFVKDQIERDYAKYLERQGKSDHRSQVNRENSNKRWEKERKSKTNDCNANGCNGNANNSDCINCNASAPLPISKSISKEIRNSIPTEDKGKTKRFAKPSPQEIKDYIKEKNLNVNPDQFYDYYESNGWMVGRNHMKDWKAALRQWNAREPNYSTQPAAAMPKATTPQSEESDFQNKDYSGRF